MTNKFKALQIGGNDLELLFRDKTNVDWDYLNPTLFTLENDYKDSINAVIKERGDFDLVFIQSSYSNELIDVLHIVSTPYNTYIDQFYWNEKFESESIVKKNIIRPFKYTSEYELQEKLKAVTFIGQYGDKIYPKDGIINPNINAQVEYLGNKSLRIKGDFGERLRPIFSWKRNLVYDKEKVIQIWPEFRVEGAIELEYTFRIIQSGSIDKIIDKIVLSHDELINPFEIKRMPFDANISVSIKAKGSGVIEIGAIHKRWSRLEMGEFLFGGERYVDNQREEFIYYFNPGDLKPPLNIYFSGYRTAEGFEAYYMMKDLGAPFLLIADPRIEGGAFYLGSKSYEQAIKNIIKEKMEYLGFSEKQLILSGLSMGSFAALYYGAQLGPLGIVVGKPLVNIGTIADNMKLLRPEEFGTALDVLLANEGNISPKHIKSMNDKFWNIFKKTNLKDTIFAIAYMEQDDYDTNAFSELLPILTNQQARVMSRGVPGRHNDDSPTITNWFINFYDIILNSKFGRIKYERK
ncbi:accessory Sec system protein Asp2 [Mammaliicoccus stepanovicii]|uniref:Accessory Sec system asp2 n=1 Tax=Mammaliicoccus stepanovicii TaxID=643214 RepID=A0A239Y9U9_9STAP|nr:accessory Sec system protein Asp2 [Mammaliicoccus stepanovicii]PNZ77482.1 accessory Sec system protein Asp2 [Mammaliicoccus stepanovicii]GGI43475.1 accessory Sec system protein Asp2 [Mammaliicoccus stepanovicii]SNV54968.1 accessory Sec system asp2 [Mammaliicoccus stepanovicii]